MDYEYLNSKNTESKLRENLKYNSSKNSSVYEFNNHLVNEKSNKVDIRNNFAKEENNQLTYSQKNSYDVIDTNVENEKEMETENPTSYAFIDPETYKRLSHDLANTFRRSNRRRKTNSQNNERSDSIENRSREAPFNLLNRSIERSRDYEIWVYPEEIYDDCIEQDKNIEENKIDLHEEVNIFNDEAVNNYYSNYDNNFKISNDFNNYDFDLEENLFKKSSFDPIFNLDSNVNNNPEALDNNFQSYDKAIINPNQVEKIQDNELNSKKSSSIQNENKSENTLEYNNTFPPEKQNCDDESD